VGITAFQLAGAYCVFCWVNASGLLSPTVILHAANTMAHGCATTALHEGSFLVIDHLPSGDQRQAV
jgi:hypothetical protein